jgi:hypothetical protein
MKGIIKKITNLVFDYDVFGLKAFDESTEKYKELIQNLYQEFNDDGYFDLDDDGYFTLDICVEDKEVLSTVIKNLRARRKEKCLKQNTIY